ncbi:unnamed protein product, partial [marine sediment metagenome]
MFRTVLKAPDTELKKAEDIVRCVVKSSWMTHESFAVYGSIVPTLGNS